jgi:hypothetical protein
MKIESGNLVWRSQGALDAGAGRPRRQPMCGPLCPNRISPGKPPRWRGNPKPDAVTQSLGNCITHDLPRPARRPLAEPIRQQSPEPSRSVPAKILPATEIRIIISGTTAAPGGAISLCTDQTTRRSGFGSPSKRET